MEPALQKFLSYLRIRTVHPTPAYAECVEFLRSYCLEIGLEFHVTEPIPGHPVCYASWKGREPGLPTVLLNSHVDVVPVVKELWHCDPFAGYLDADGNIVARGTQDMKSVTIQHLEAIRKLKESGFQPLRTIHLTFVPDEEIGGGMGMGKFIESEEFRSLNVGVSLDEGLASPDETFSVFYGERLPWWVNIRAVGPTGHGSRFIENTAVEKLMRLVSKVQAFRVEQKHKHDHGTPLGEVITVNITKLQAGVSSDGGRTYQLNVIPTTAEAGLDIRLPPTVEPAAFLAQLDAWLAEDGLDREFVWHAMTNPVTPVGSAAKAKWWRVLEASLHKHGIPFRTQIFPASTDGRFLRCLGVPVFGFSPMNHTPVLLHDHNERLHKDVFLRGIDHFVNIITDLSMAEPSAVE